MKYTLLFLLLGFLSSETTYAQQSSTSPIPDSISVDKVEEFKERYDNYLGLLDRGAVSSFSTFRNYYIQSTSSQYKDDRVLYPSDNFFKIDIPAYFLMSYILSFKNDRLVDVSIVDITILDTGFTVIYNEEEGEKSKNYYNLDINKKALEERLFDQLSSREIEIKHQNDKDYEDIKLQIFYHQEPKLGDY